MNEMIDVTHGLDMSKTPQNYIVFGPFEPDTDWYRTCLPFGCTENCSHIEPSFDSRRFGLFLHQRTATTPSEKEVVASIPYMQGVVDMSNLLGHRVYENREITYVFYRFGVQKNTARDVQTTIENLLMREFDQQLHDSFEPDFHYLGKCREVVVEDEFAFRRMRIQISFNLYPFKVDNFMESADLFDPFNFDLDAFQRIEGGLSYSITGERKIQLYNSGQKVLVPTVAVTGGSAEMTNNSIPYGITGSARQYPGFRLLPGMNEVTLRATDGSPTVSFDWRKERI